MSGLLHARLMYPDGDFDRAVELPAHASATETDLGADIVARAMAAQDEYVLNVARVALLADGRPDVAAVRYRQGALADGLANPAVVRELYDIAVAGSEARRRSYLSIFTRYPNSILSGAVEMLELLMESLRALRRIAETSTGFRSAAFTGLFAMLRRELDDAYLARLDEHLTMLKFKHGLLLSAGIAETSVTTAHVLRAPHPDERGWLDRLLHRGPPSFTFRVADRDDAGLRAISELRDRALNIVANAVAQSADHVMAFFDMLRAELAFYVGCLNLHDALARLGAPTCTPVPTDPPTGTLHAIELYDVALALTLRRAVVTNSFDADRARAIVITGANQGGKSTFLRAVGLAHLMMQAGMFVGAQAFDAALRTGVFTHFRREEDVSMTQGKLDEELSRMSDIAGQLRPGALVLFNESFATTNEREGSEIARQVVSALLDAGVRCVVVTHLYEFASRLYGDRAADVLFLRAERLPDGTRTFKLVEAPPLETSFGEDVYREVFNTDASEHR